MIQEITFESAEVLTGGQPAGPCDIPSIRNNPISYVFCLITTGGTAYAPSMRDLQGGGGSRSQTGGPVRNQP